MTMLAEVAKRDKGKDVRAYNIMNGYGEIILAQKRRQFNTEGGHTQFQQSLLMPMPLEVTERCAEVNVRFCPLKSKRGRTHMQRDSVCRCVL